MMDTKILVLFSLFVTVLAKKGSLKVKNHNDVEESIHSTKKNKHYNNLETTSGQASEGSVGDVAVDKFIETLMASERYLKTIEIVDRKLFRLDATFHDRMNTIFKQLSQMLTIIKTSELINKGLTEVKTDLEKVKRTLTNQWEESKFKNQNNMRVDGVGYHPDSSLETRLSLLEEHMKNILAGVESIVSTISEVKNRQYIRTSLKQDMGGAMDTMTLMNEFRKTLREQKTRKCECKSGRVDRSERYPTDCHEIQMQGFNVSGIYKIKPEDMEPFYILCDLTTAGGAWTVFQNRFDGSQDFYKGWSDYKYGFGNLAGEFWLGLEKLSYLTNQKLYELRIELETQHGEEAFAGYSVFTIGPEHEGYRISTLGTYYGTAGDSLTYHAGQKFSTFDEDNDEWKDGTCASEHGGAWWYKECDKSNINGKYSSSPEENRGQSIYWISFKSPNYQLTKTKMMIRPLPASKPIDFGDSSRKILGQKPRIAADQLKGIHTKDAKGTFDSSQSRSPYRYDDAAHADAFFPNYA